MGGLRGICPPFLEIARSRPSSSDFCFFRPFPEGPNGAWKIHKMKEKGLFPQISSDLLKPPSLRLPFAALQRKTNKHEEVRRDTHFLTATIPWTCLVCPVEMSCLSRGHSTPNMTRRRFHRTTEVIPRRPWKSKSPLLPDLIKQVKTQGCKGCIRGTTRYFLHAFPSYGPPVVNNSHCKTVSRTF